MTDAIAVDNEEENDLLTHYLANRDVPCPTCGYNLRDLRDCHCPECGHSLAVGLGNNSGLSMQWVWAFSASCLAVPIGMIALGINSFIGTVAPPDDTDWLKIIFTMAYIIGMLPGLDLLITRKRFIRYSFTKQERVARGVIIYQAIILGLFLAIIFINHI